MFPPGPDGLVFTAPKGGPIRRPTFYRLVWSKATQAVGLEGFPFCNLRHTGATLALQEGTNPVLVAFRLGHASTAMIERHYGELVDGFDREIADRLSAVGQVAQNSRSRPRLIACRGMAVSQDPPKGSANRTTQCAGCPHPQSAASESGENAMPCSGSCGCRRNGGSIHPRCARSLAHSLCSIRRGIFAGYSVFESRVPSGDQVRTSTLTLDFALVVPTGFEPVSP
jgi:hypothetical protein